MIIAYADETGTGGIPKSGKEPAPGIGGYLASPEKWEQFKTSWASMLKKYGVDYFHFRELDKKERSKTNSHYFGWDDFKVDDFIHDMAFMASCCPIIPFGGNASVKIVHGITRVKEDLNESYHRAFNAFFVCFSNSMNKHFPNEKGKVRFFFEENGNKEWISILDKVIKKKRKGDSRIGEFTTISSTSDIGVPCQVADLFVALNRQFNETFFDRRGFVPQRVLDIILARQAFPDWHPYSEIKRMPDAEFKKIIDELRARKKHFDLHHQLSGTHPKPQYYPTIEHPYFIHLYSLCHEHRRKNPKLWMR